MVTEIKYQVGVDTLLNVLQLSYDTKLSYTQLINITNDECVEELLELKVEHLSNFMSKILTELNTMYITPILKSSFNASLERFGINLRYTLVDIDDISIINKSLKLDNTLHTYISNEIKKGMYTKNVYNLLQEEMDILYQMMQPNGYNQLHFV